MPYETFPDALKKLQIDHVLFVKFGCICVKDPSIKTAATRQLFLLWDEDKHPNPHERIVQALEKNGNVFDLRVIMERNVVIAAAEDNQLFVDGPVFSLRINLPSRMQKYREETTAPVEEFAVISSGSLFAAFVEVQDYPNSIYIGHEYREIAYTQIKNATPLEKVNLGPTPIHPDFYIVFTSTGGPAPPKRIYSIGEDIFVVMRKDECGDIDGVKTLYIHVLLKLLKFYRIMMDQHVLTDKSFDVTTNFSELGNTFKQVLQTSFWMHPISRIRLASLARATLSNIRISLVDREILLLAINKDKAGLFEDIKGSKILSPLLGYFREHTELRHEVPESLSPALEYFSGELQTFRNIEALIIATVAGAAIGAVLTAFFTSASSH